MNINEYFNQIYVINLDSRPDRMASVEKQLENANISNYKRFSAIKVEPENLSRYSTVSYDRFEKKYSKYILGSLGCKLSHLAVIKEAQENDYDRILILEDDILIDENIDVMFEKATNQLKEWDMFYLGGNYRYGGLYANGNKWEQDVFSDNIQKLKGAMCACAYGLSKNIYGAILNNAFQSGQEIDIFYYSMHQFRNEFGYYGVIPEIITQIAENNSDIK